MKDEFGDFQTPSALVRDVRVLLERDDVRWSRLLEPTCGRGSFLEGFAESAEEMIGIEIQSAYVQEAENRLAELPLSGRWQVLTRSIFETNVEALPWESNGPLLVVGNPPWVTNADLGRFDLTNLPKKQNVKLLSGLDAITGSANFDIAEYIWIKLIEHLRGQEVTYAMLSKTHTARNVLEYVGLRGHPVEHAAIYNIDARVSFGASVDACLLVLGLKPQGEALREVRVFDDLFGDLPTDRLTLVNGSLLRAGDETEFSPSAYLGSCEFEWRQGIKHDAARVMELYESQDGFRQKSGTPVQVEAKFVYPLMKGTDVFHGRRPDETGRRVLVYQKELGAATAPLERHAPLLWEYLTAHASKLDGRKSSIYRSQPRFALFGLGEYSFKPFKVAVSGLHKEPRFRLVGPHADRPVMFDDTCYLLGFDRAEHAAIVGAALQEPVAQALLRAITFTDSKRPVKKSVLKRLRFRSLFNEIGRSRLQEGATRLAADADLVLRTLPDPFEILDEQRELFDTARSAG